VDHFYDAAVNGPNGGGDAVASYRRLSPWLGTMDDLESLTTALRDLGMSVYVDLVLDHTAGEHESALAGGAWSRAPSGGQASPPDDHP